MSTAGINATPIPLDDISPGNLNPRSFFDEEALTELAESIKTHGLVQPIVLRPTAGQTFNAATDIKKQYTIVAGERRYRAARIAGLTEIPAIVRQDLTDQAALEVTILENLHRADLEPLDEARAFGTLRDLCGMKGKAIAAAVNRSQDYVAASLRLLDLPPNTQALIERKQLSLGQARALWKYRQFPDFVDALAQATADRPSYITAESIADLEELFGWMGPSRFGIPKEIAVEIPGARYHEPQFEECNNCPFGARFKGYCLKPAHYEELYKRHHAEEEKEAQEKREALRAQHGDLPVVSDLGRSDYKTIYPHETPRGCGPDCPCRSQALDSHGRVISICTDPKRWDGLKRRQTREDNAARRKKDADDTDLITRYIDSWTEIPEEALHMLALIALQHAGPTRDEPYMRHIKPLLGDKNGAYRTNLDVGGTLHLSVPTDALIRAAVEAICLGELEAHARVDAQSVSYTSRKYTDFLLPYTTATQHDMAWRKIASLFSLMGWDKTSIDRLKAASTPEEWLAHGDDNTYNLTTWAQSKLNKPTPKDTEPCGSDSTTASSPDARSGARGETPSSSTSPASSTAAATAPTGASSAPTSKKSRTTPGSKKARSAA